MDGIPALDLWDLIVTVLHGKTYQNDQERRDPSKSPTRKEIPGKNDDLDNVDFISSNIQSSHQEALLYILEDNEAVIKMIMKGRSTTMRHVSRTTELLLIGCLVESIWTPRSKSNILTPKPNSQTILTKGNFSRDEWNHLLCLFNISHFSSINGVKAMSKRTQKKMQVKKESQQNQSR